VNGIIEKNLEIFDGEVPFSAADKINTLRKVPGEKYPDPVRVVSIGVPITELLQNPTNPEWLNYSVEFCGGTHLRQTKPIERFTITAEESIGKGIRRIVAVTGSLAREAFKNRDQFGVKLADVEKAGQFDKLTDLLKELSNIELPASSRIHFREKIEKLQAKKKEGLKKDESKQHELVNQFVQDTISQITSSGAPFLVSRLDAACGQSAVMVEAAKKINEKLPKLPILFISEANPTKVTITAKVPPSLTAIFKEFKAFVWAGEAAAACGGRGGGRDETAAGSGNDAKKIDEAIDKAILFAKQNLESLGI